MIKAKHKKWADLIFKPYIFNLLRKHFHSIHILNDFPEVNKNIPLIFTPIHSTWWDGFFVYLLNKRFLNRKFYIMILEEQLAKYKFFVKLGGYSINQKNPKKIVESLKYSSRMMREYPNSLFNIFPQGELLPVNIKPLKYNNGINKIIDYYEGKVQVLNISVLPLFLKEQNPQLFFKFGKLKEFDKNNNIDMTEHQIEMSELLNEINYSVNNDNTGKIILKGKKSVSE